MTRRSRRLFRTGAAGLALATALLVLSAAPTQAETAIRYGKVYNGAEDAAGTEVVQANGKVKIFNGRGGTTIIKKGYHSHGFRNFDGGGKTVKKSHGGRKTVIKPRFRNRFGFNQYRGFRQGFPHDRGLFHRGSYGHGFYGAHETGNGGNLLLIDAAETVRGMDEGYSLGVFESGAPLTPGFDPALFPPRPKVAEHSGIVPFDPALRAPVPKPSRFSGRSLRLHEFRFGPQTPLSTPVSVPRGTAGSGLREMLLSRPTDLNRQHPVAAPLRPNTTNAIDRGGNSTLRVGRIQLDNGVRAQQSR